MPFFSRKPNSRSNPVASSDAASQRSQPENTDNKISLSRLFRKTRHQDATPQGIDKTAVRNQQAASDRLDQHGSVDTTKDTPQTHEISQSNAAPMKPDDLNILPNAAKSEARQLEGAQGFNISGNPVMTNIGMNTGVNNVTTTTVNYYGGTHGLENLKDSVSFASLHDSAEQDPTRRCHPGTRKNVLSRLHDWIDDPNTADRIAWLHGPAGSGKSAIAQTIAHAYEDGEVAATFFFYRSDSSRSNGNRLFPTIAWQLAFLNPALKDNIVHALDKTPHLPRKDVETQFKQLVARPFHSSNNIAPQMTHPAPVVIIDGLDECSDEQLQRRILAIIGNAIKDCLVPLRFLICSRPEALIEEALDAFKDITLWIDLATLDDSNRDIEKYLVDQFSDIRSKRCLASTWPSSETIEEFVFKSSGNFIFAATVMRYISDEDYNPEEQLDIVRNLKPRGKTSPFALLDELYLEILKQQKDQDFLKIFLALLVGRSTAGGDDLHEDDPILMNILKKDLHTKLRRMRSLLKFEPFIDVHHKSFLDFLQDLSRSGEYHTSIQGGQKRYLELIVDCVVRHISMAIEHPNDHENCHFRPKFGFSIIDVQPNVALPVEDWQEVLKPLLDLQDRLFNGSKFYKCYINWVMRSILLHLIMLQGKSQHFGAAHVCSNTNSTVTERAFTPVTRDSQNLSGNDLDKCLYALLSCTQEADTVTAAAVRSVKDAQKLIDLIDSMINNESFLSQCDRATTCKATLLVSEIFARVPLLPQSIFLNRFPQHSRVSLAGGFWVLEFYSQSMLISRILDHSYILPASLSYEENKFIHGNVDEENEPLDGWIRRSKPNFVTRIRIMLQVARVIQYIHSRDVIAVNHHGLELGRFTLDSNMHVKFMFHGVFTWQAREELVFDDDGGSDNSDQYTCESNIDAFGQLFDQVCFKDVDEHVSDHLVEDTKQLIDLDQDADKHLPDHLVEDTKQLIERCRSKDPKSRPTMKDVVKEMEAWNLT